MKTKARYRLPIDLKNEFSEHVEIKYGKRRTSFELEKAMKLYLAIFSDKDFDDIDIQSYRSKFNCTHTQNSKNVDNGEISGKNLKEDVVKKQVRYRESRMDQFVACFLEEYGSYQQVSMNELKKLVIDMHGVTDPRSIQNRVEYLMSTGYIEPYTTNVYNILF